jgi:transposase
LIYTWRRKLLDAGAAHEADVPEVMPVPVFAEAVVGENPAAAASLNRPGIAGGHLV